MLSVSGVVVQNSSNDFRGFRGIRCFRGKSNNDVAFCSGRNLSLVQHNEVVNNLLIMGHPELGGKLEQILESAVKLLPAVKDETNPAAKFFNSSFRKVLRTLKKDPEISAQDAFCKGFGIKTTSDYEIQSEIVNQFVSIQKNSNYENFMKKITKKLYTKSADLKPKVINVPILPGVINNPEGGVHIENVPRYTHAQITARINECRNIFENGTHSEKQAYLKRQEMLNS